MFDDYTLIKKASAAVNLANVLSIGQSSSFFKTVIIAFVYDEIGGHSNKRNNIIEFFFSIVRKKFLTSKEEIVTYYEMLDEFIVNGIVKSDKYNISFGGVRPDRKATASKIKIIERILQISDIDFARLFVQYV